MCIRDRKYIGIDLGTPNSAICSYDGESVRLFKSPDQNDVTPSAIFIDRRGNKYLGKRAYDSAAKNPDNAATKFKRMMGTSTPVTVSYTHLDVYKRQLLLCGAEAGTALTVQKPDGDRPAGDRDPSRQEQQG